MGATRDGLIVTMLVFNILFPTFAYAFTTLADMGLDTGSYLDPDVLLFAGIRIENSTTHTIVWGGGWVEYDMGDLGDYRLSWDNFMVAIYPTDGFQLQKRSNPLDRLLSTWIFPEIILFQNEDSISYNGDLVLSNETVITSWDETYGWSRFTPLSTSQNLFFTFNSSISANFTEAMDADGSVVATFANLAEEDMSLNGFIAFYTGLILGDALYGLPPTFAWIIRLITALSILSLAWLIKDLISL